MHTPNPFATITAAQRAPSALTEELFPSIYESPAAKSLLGEVGFAGTTVQEISRRSGVHPPAIYRRWPSRLALIEDAAFSGLTEIGIKPTGG